MSEPMSFKKIVVGPMAVNCYVLFERPGSAGIVIDPGGETRAVEGMLRELRIQLVGIALTHAHVDHAAGAAQLAEATGAPVLLHPGDEELLQVLPMQAQLFGLEKPAIPTDVQRLEDGLNIALGNCAVEVRHTPGHSPGSVCFLDSAGRQAWVGDLIFRGSVGRTDLPGGSSERLFRSIRGVILALDDDWRLYPGHGPETTVGEERRQNPFLQETFGPL